MTIKITTLKKARGYFLIIAIILLVVTGFLGAVVAQLFANEGYLTAITMNGVKTFYIAESGLETGTRLLTLPTFTGTPIRIGCNAINTYSPAQSVSLNGGTFSLSASPNYVAGSLSSGISASSNSISLISTVGFASTGVVTIDREAIIYRSISGNNLVNIIRGASGTSAVSHASGAPVGQYICTLTSSANMTNAALQFQRILSLNIPQQDAWAVGQDASNNGAVDHWNYPTGVSWNFSSIGSISPDYLNAVSVLSNASAFAVGQYQSGSMVGVRWNGSNWSAMNFPTPVSGCTQNLNAISVVSSQEGWAVGDQCRTSTGPARFRFTMLKMTNNGNTWQLLSSATTPSIPADDTNTNVDHLNAVSVIDTTGNGLGNIGFAVGQAGKVLRYNGVNWVDDSMPGNQNMFGVATVSTQEAWAVGASGEIRRWNGSSWSTFSSPTNTRLNAVAMLDTNGDGLADMGVAVGNSGRVLMYNGTSWSDVDSNTNRNLLGVAIYNANDAWAVGANGEVIHWNGSTWVSSIDSDTNRTLRGVDVVRNNSSPSGWRQTFN